LEACVTIPDVLITGIVTAPKSFAISYRPNGVTNCLHFDFVQMANEHGLPLAMLERSMREPNLLQSVTAWKPDMFLVAGWYHMIPPDWRQLAPAYGLHASLLPDYSGGAPLVWAMINGENKTGISLFQIDDGVDTGPIAGQKVEPIFPDDTIATLYTRIEDRGLELLREVLPALKSGQLILRTQDNTMRRTFPQRGPEDGRIDWRSDALSINRFIRAQTHPYPGAFTMLAGKPLHIWSTTLVESASEEELGLIQRTNSGTYNVFCGTGSIKLESVTYDSVTYNSSQLMKLLGKGGQQLASHFRQ
jgi:methionyl-tRNA formyltransferase